ncbi:hypothetical protein F0562_031867 [Nyssa sinensis]|uniref:Fungal lipase-type domain-containing protein n=1 Tax=Nyssa sinensis TaxID=561372 RepID=A0A5J5AWX6_9ASTE|nr:hypothetical protein F0562_031867 [Nyssa sinensis]
MADRLLVLGEGRNGLLELKYARARSKQMQQPDDCWRHIYGEDDWKGMLDPLDPRLRRELIRYGEMAKSCYDAFESSRFSDNFGNCKFTHSNLFESLEMGNPGYEVSAYLYAASKNSSWRRFWKNNAKWIGYVAVSNDETSKRLGYRDITIAWKGTKTMSKWIIDFKNILKPILVEHDPTIKAESGFLHLYTDKDESCEDRKYSTREQILNAVKRLIQLYQNEELSISITGHSLGSALAILSAYDIALERAHNMMNDSRVIPIFVFSYSGPRVGNNKLKERLESLGVKVLRIVNVNDIVPKLPRVVFNENQPKMLMKLTESLSWNYWHVGVKLTIGQKIKSCDLMIKSRDLISAHKLENLLDLLKEV